MITTVVIELYYRIGKKSTLLKGCSDSANESNLLSNLFREEVPYADIEKIAADRLAINERESELRKAAVEEVRKVVKALNITQEELFAEPRAPRVSRPRGETVPYYRNPENPAETCGKLGRKPAWYNEALKRGVSQEEMRIK